MRRPNIAQWWARLTGRAELASHLADLAESVRLHCDSISALQVRIEAAEKAAHVLKEAFHAEITDTVEAAASALEEAKDERRSARAAEERTRRAIERAVVGSLPAGQAQDEAVAGEGGGEQSMLALPGEGRIVAPGPRKLRRPI